MECLSSTMMSRMNGPSATSLRNSASRSGITSSNSAKVSASSPPADNLGGERWPADPSAGFLARAEVRDVLAWVRLLVDPQDAAAVVRRIRKAVTA